MIETKYPTRKDFFIREMSNLLAKYHVGFCDLDGLATEFRFSVEEGEFEEKISLQELLDAE